MMYDIDGNPISGGSVSKDKVFLDTVAPYSSTDLTGYSGTVADFYSAYDALVTAYPDYVSKTVIGMDQTNTYEIREYHFRPETLGYGNENFPATETINEVELPLILIDGAIHGNEQASAWVLLHFMKKVCNEWENHPTFKFYRWNVEFRVIPIVNPYGFTHNTRTTSKTQYDPNRYFNRTDAWLQENIIEAYYVKQQLDTYKDAFAFIDCHTAWAGEDRDLAWLISSYNIHEDIANSVITTLTRQWKKQYPSITYDGLMGYTGEQPRPSEFMPGRLYAYSVGLTNSWCIEFANTFKNMENTKFGPYTCNAYMDLFMGLLNALAQMMGAVINVPNETASTT